MLRNIIKRHMTKMAILYFIMNIYYNPTYHQVCVTNCVKSKQSAKSLDDPASWRSERHKIDTIYCGEIVVLLSTCSEY